MTIVNDSYLNSRKLEIWYLMKKWDGILKNKFKCACTKYWYYLAVKTNHIPMWSHMVMYYDI